MAKVDRVIPTQSCRAVSISRGDRLSPLERSSARPSHRRSGRGCIKLKAA